jgi:ATP-dependent Clp protease ATP-binding subunit ClpC
MFERYTEKARRVIFFARYYASQPGALATGTEHLLLGLLHEDRFLINRLLRRPSTAETIQREIEQQAAGRGKVSTMADMPLSREAKRILSYAAEESDLAGHREIRTEHILLGLLREEESWTVQLLREHGMTLETARAQLAGERKPEVTAEKIVQLEQTLEFNEG